MLGWKEWGGGILKFWATFSDMGFKRRPPAVSSAAVFARWHAVQAVTTDLLGAGGWSVSSLQVSMLAGDMDSHGHLVRKRCRTVRAGDLLLRLLRLRYRSFLKLFDSCCEVYEAGCLTRRDSPWSVLGEFGGPGSALASYGSQAGGVAQPAIQGGCVLLVQVCRRAGYGTDVLVFSPTYLV